MREMDVQTLSSRLEAGDPPFLIDVREDHELDICKLPYDLHIPLGSVAARMNEIPTDREVVVYCRSGGRSGQATEYLAGQGFENVANLVGGVLQWGREVDPAMPAY